MSEKSKNWFVWPSDWCFPEIQNKHSSFMARSFAEAAINYADYAPVVFPLMTWIWVITWVSPYSLRNPMNPQPKNIPQLKYHVSQIDIQIISHIHTGLSENIFTTTLFFLVYHQVPHCNSLFSDKPKYHIIPNICPNMSSLRITWRWSSSTTQKWKGISRLLSCLYVYIYIYIPCIPIMVGFIPPFVGQILRPDLLHPRACSMTRARQTLSALAGFKAKVKLEPEIWVQGCRCPWNPVKSDTWKPHLDVREQPCCNPII